MKLSQPNCSSHLVPAVCIYVQYMLYFSGAQMGKENPVGLFEEGKSNWEKSLGSVFALAWENVSEYFPMEALEAEIP